MDWVAIIFLCLIVIVIFSLFILAMIKTQDSSYQRHRIPCSCGHVHYHNVDDVDD